MTSTVPLNVKCLLDAYVGGGQLPGAFVACIKKDSDKPLYMYQTGWKEVQDEKLHGNLGERALYRIYSMTKPIVSVLTMIIRDEGTLELDDPISKYLPMFKKHPKVMEADGKLSEAQRPITIRHLLTHTSGFTYGFFPSFPKIVGMYQDRKMASLDEIFGNTAKEICEKLSQIPLCFHPGDHFQYSLSTDVLGYLLEVATGKTLSQLLQEKLLGPLEMSDTTFKIPEEDLKRVHPLYFLEPGFTITRNMKGYEDTEARGLGKPPVLESGGGGLFSTGEDYLKFMQFLLNEGEYKGRRLMKKKTFKEMTETNQLKGNKTLAESILPGGYPALSGKGWNLIGSIVTDDSISHHGAIGEYGWGGYASTYFQVDPSNGIAFLLLTQVVPSGGLYLRPQLSYAVHNASS
eukprot:CAMPEP_0114511876 /NCGR_PEP_ID=MMETSP0109-20121206/14650_1 /TAXON_ID=29199 /ORGANISM="Chlorarachnion reptans, Strain CCCM449" /LENGTH=403 /DNA_ID=CAMNT_0001691471 /DNA_START=35 /DNA_END=1246 /DNA_ORIENTATION=+